MHLSCGATSQIYKYSLGISEAPQVTKDPSPWKKEMRTKRADREKKHKRVCRDRLRALQPIFYHPLAKALTSFHHQSTLSNRTQSDSHYARSSILLCCARHCNHLSSHDCLGWLSSGVQQCDQHIVLIRSPVGHTKDVANTPCQQRR
jgi:hypothetical protein